MKILRLRLTNLNSLRGTSEVDFTRPPFSTSGLFAITGPTGAGKSTLLDAITLALYGRAARYGRDSNPESVMSRHTGECSAEVEFSCASGTYRSTWQLQRARKKADGRFQQAKRRLISLPAETVIAESIKDADARLEELTGLDYDRFLRSVLLAQGDFAAFLRADAKQRTELLQEVTGTEIYQEISAAAFRRFTEAQRRHEELLRELDAVPVLAPETRAGHEAQRREAQAQIMANTASCSALEGRISNARRRVELDHEARSLQEELTRLDGERSAFAPELERLLAHERAAAATADLSALSQLLDERSRTTIRLGQIDAALPDAAQRLAEAETALVAANAAFRGEEERRDAFRPVWTKVVALDQEIAASRVSVRQVAELRRQWTTQLQTATDSRTAELKSQQKLQGEQDTVKEWLSQHAGDAHIATLMPDMRAALEGWSSLVAAIESARSELIDAHSGAERLERQTAELRKAVPPLEELCLQRKTALERAVDALEKTGWKNKSDAFERLREHCRSKRASLEKIAEIARRHARLLEELARQRKVAEANREALTLAIEACGTVQRQGEEAAASIATLGQALRFAERVQSLDSHRSELKEGEPCPLCGAAHHPYAGKTAVLGEDVTAARKTLAAAEARLKALQSRHVESEKTKAAREADMARLEMSIRTLDTDTADMEKRWREEASQSGLDAAAGTLDEAERALAAIMAEEQGFQRLALTIRSLEGEIASNASALQEAQSSLGKAQASLATSEALTEQAKRRLPILARVLSERQEAAATACSNLNRILGSLAPPQSDPTAARTAIAALSARATEFAGKQRLAEQLAAQLATLGEKISGLTRRITEAGEALRDCERKEALLGEAQDKTEAERRRLIGERSVEAEQRACEAELKRLQRALDDERTRVERCRSVQAALVQEKELLLGEQMRRIVQEAALEMRLRTLASTGGFSSIEQMRSALLPSDEASALAARRQRIAQEVAVAEERSAQVSRASASLPGEAAADAARLEALVSERETLSNERTQLERSLGAIDEILRNDDAQRARQASVAGRIEQAHREFARWDKLRALIGSADGSAFARFAQGLTLERLTLLANRHLDQLNPRYSMRRARSSDAGDLELEIVDHYQADAVRPMRSLSGGECFLASLALALGLSELASGRTTIESLFIDEGFGSLDADTLETAMAALEALQSRGKIIGVISHVSAMQERIHAQIRIAKESGGCSSLTVAQ